MWMFGGGKMRVALTGHRPERLGFSELDFETPFEWRRIIDWLKDQLLILDATDTYCGMASGCDIAFGIATMEINNETWVKKYYDRNKISLHCVLPCKNYNNHIKWHEILKYGADEWIELADEFYKGCDNVRDQYMVNHCDVLIAIWDGNKSGGVWSTIRKAQKADKTIIYCPKEILETKRLILFEKERTV